MWVYRHKREANTIDSATLKNHSEIQSAQSKTQFAVCYTFVMKKLVTLYDNMITAKWVKRCTQLRLKNKAGYTATPVACGWAGAIFEVTFWQEQWGQRPQKQKKSKVWWTDRQTDRQTDGRTDRRTDGPTDGPTKRGVESRSTRLTTATRIKGPTYRMDNHHIDFKTLKISQRLLGQWTRRSNPLIWLNFRFDLL